jgi:hypothetical protein
MSNKFTSKDYYFFLLFLFLSILIITSGGGADFHQYLIWSKYFSTLNLDVFSEYPKSKNGLPLVAWYYGVGLLSSVVSKIFFLEEVIVMKANSAILTIINFALFYKIATNYKISKFSFLFLISITYLLLPAGFYLNKYSSETWTVFLTLLSIFLIEHNIKNFRNFRKISLVAFGIVLYFLILIKITNVFLALGLLLIFYVKKFGKISINKKNFYKYFEILFFGLFFIFFAFLLLAIYHKLLNDGFLASHYNYGDNKFSSFSLSNFKVIEVLFSTWHGLLFYHPFYLASIFLVLTIFFKKIFSKDNSKWILLITLIVFFVQLLIQSSHATWWMGIGTYGARGFAGVSILTLYSILNIKSNFKPIKYNLFFKLITLTVLGYQTYLFTLGLTNFYTLSNFFDFFFSKYSLILFFLITFILALIVIFKKIFNYSFSKILQITIISMAFFAAIAILFTHKKPYFLLSIAILFSYFFSYFVQNYINKMKLLLNIFTHKTVSIIFIFLFLFSIYFQTILFTQYKENMQPNFISGKSFDCNEAAGSYHEYNLLSNYKYEKKIWLNFLRKSNCI